jgi:hypothetical protein
MKDLQYAMDCIDSGRENPSKTVYNPNHLIDTLSANLRMKNDAALCRVLEVSAPVISRIRTGSLPISGSILLRMHEVSGLSIKDLRFLLGDRRAKFRTTTKKFRY